MTISARIINLVANDVVFLTLEKRKLFPASTIQARGYIGAGTSVTMEKRLIWLSPVKGDASSGEANMVQDEELAEGKETVQAWLEALASHQSFDARIIIAGDENPVSGMLPAIGRQGNWDMHLSTTDEDDSVSVDFFHVPRDVMQRMSESRQQ